MIDKNFNYGRTDGDNKKCNLYGQLYIPDYYGDGNEFGYGDGDGDGLPGGRKCYFPLHEKFYCNENIYFLSF